MGIFILRFLMVAGLTAAGYFLPAFGLPRAGSAALSFAIGGIIIYLETIIRRTQFKTIWGSTVGTYAGVFLGWSLGAVYQKVAADDVTSTFIRLLFLIILPYIGFLVGTQRSEWLDPAHLLRFFKEKSRGRSYKILDTSVIIDGRVTDLCDTGFIEGTLVLPQFVLKELQFIADSPDGLKRQRGRRGLDVLNHLQKSSQISVVIWEEDFPEIRDVDSKLIELARQLDGKLITNDVNLSKVAKLRGVPIMNINELANALRPVVLPGETMKVFVIKEGKEKDQGVAYLDDGTMVVVDNSRRMIGLNIDVTVTSVLQTTVGKMIFARYNDEVR